MRILSLGLAAALSAATAAHAEEAAGDWLGVIKAPTLGDLTLALHLRKTGTAYEGTLDDITLGIRGMALKNVEATGDRLAFEAPAARGRFEATWDAAAGQWVGTWKSPGAEAGLPLRLARGLPPPTPKVEGLDGDWQGAINTGSGGLLRLIFHIRTGPDGTLVTSDSPDQGVSGVPVAGVQREGRQVAIDMRGIRADLKGELLDDGATIQGEFSQGQLLAPIVLKRTGDSPTTLPSALNREPLPERWSLPDDPAIRQVLVRRIDEERRGVGMVVGVISPKGRRVVSYGGFDVGEARRVDGDTLFEIGSISKTFTSLVLQDMALRGEVSLDDPVAKYLPPEVRVPSRNGKAITLRQLATHMSGLPRDVPNPKIKRQQDALAGIGEADLYRFLSTYELIRDPGAEWDYSNLGVGLLGIALSRRAGTDLETLIRQRATVPLGMPSTTMIVGPAIKTRLAIGHDAYLRPAETFDIGPAEAAAGALRSSGNEMLNLLAAELGYRKTPLAPAMAAMLTQEGPGMTGGFKQALGWMTLDLPSGHIVTHSGGTFGQRAFTAFNPKTREGVVVLSNAEGAAGPDEIGLWIISGMPVRPLPPAPPAPALRAARAEVVLGAEAAQPYLGRYRLSPSIFMTLGYADGHMTLLSEARGRTGQPTPVTWHGGADFSAPNGGGDRADMTFERDVSGKPFAFIWRGPAGEFLVRRQ